MASIVKRLVTEKYGALTVIEGGLRTEKLGNDKVTVDFNPGWGLFQITITPKEAKK